VLESLVKAIRESGYRGTEEQAAETLRHNVPAGESSILFVAGYFVNLRPSRWRRVSYSGESGAMSFRKEGGRDRWRSHRGGKAASGGVVGRILRVWRPQFRAMLVGKIPGQE
jgi:hypothetical protein